jgi:hypothetical protein
VTKVKIDASRFIRVNVSESYGTSLIRHLHRVLEKGDIADFLSRLWALFGAPDIEDKGFSYTFKDIETMLLFTAYSASSGPCYGGIRGTEKELLPVVRLFDELLSQITPVDCEIEFQTDFGNLLFGSRNGAPYEKVRRHKAPR